MTPTAALTQGPATIMLPGSKTVALLTITSELTAAFEQRIFNPLQLRKRVFKRRQAAVYKSKFKA